MRHHVGACFGALERRVLDAVGGAAQQLRDGAGARAAGSGAAGGHSLLQVLRHGPGRGEPWQPLGRGSEALAHVARASVVDALGAGRAGYIRSSGVGAAPQRAGPSTGGASGMTGCWAAGQAGPGPSEGRRGGTGMGCLLRASWFMRAGAAARYRPQRAPW